jgi:uncharacterized protein (UPF0333 family)
MRKTIMKTLQMLAIVFSIIVAISLTTSKIANADLAPARAEGNAKNAASLGLNGINGDLQMCALSTNSCGQGSGSTCDINATCPDSPKKYNTSS